VKAVASLQKQNPGDHQLPAKGDDPYYCCKHIKVLVFMVTCCNAIVCRSCADKIEKYRIRGYGCPFCQWCIGNIVEV